MPRISRNRNVQRRGFAAGLFLNLSQESAGTEKETAWQAGVRAMERLAEEPSPHLADLRLKAQVLLDYQKTAGLTGSCSGYHSLIRSLAEDVLARSSS